MGGDTDVICSCSENELLLYLKDAVQNQDLDRVVRTLRGRELRFQDTIDKLSRELDELRKENGEMKRKYEACLKRELEREQPKHKYENDEGLLSGAHTPRVSTPSVRRTLHFPKQDTITTPPSFHHHPHQQLQPPPQNPIVISDTETESSGTPLTKKSICKKASCTPKTQSAEEQVETQSGTPLTKKNICEKASCTPVTQSAEKQVETQSRLHIAGSDGEQSSHNEEQLMHTSAKTKRGHRAVVRSESESDSSEVVFTCKRRRWAHLDLGTQGGMHGTSVSGLGEAEPYECSEREEFLSNEEPESEAVPLTDVKHKRIQKIKDVNHLSSAEHTCPIPGKVNAATDFRPLQGVKEASELYKTGKFEEGMCSVDEAPVAKYRRLKRVLEASGPEKSKFGKTFADMQEQITSDADINNVQKNTTFSDNDHGEYKAASAGVSTRSIANTKKSTGDSKLAEGLSINLIIESDGEEDKLSEPPIHCLNSRTRRNRPRKMINLIKESDGEDDEVEDENTSQVEDLGGFIVDSSESGTHSECSSKLKGSTSDSLNSIGNVDSDADSSSGEDLDEVIRKISRQSKSTLDWKYEGEMLAAFAKDNVLCMRAVCALYRQQTNEEKCGKSSLYLNRRGFAKTHALRGSLLAEFLTENDPFGPMKKSVEELKKHDSKGIQYCTDLAIHHSKQLFEIYKNNEDPHFPHR